VSARRPRAANGSAPELGLAEREAALAVSEQALRLKEAALEARLRTTERMEAALREANEKLVIASVKAQTLTEIAEQATAQMAHMAEHDFLTGLPNRALLTDRLVQSIALAQRYRRKVALMYLDLDNFKDINDALGHVVGDRVLQSTAKRLQACVRQSDTVSRHGGDEFVVLLEGVRSGQDAVLTAEKLLATMAEPHLVDGQRLHVTVSIGISLYPDDGQDIETVVRNADAAMYRAKQSGRNRYRLFSPDMEARTARQQPVSPPHVVA
jgi:diguanylate cyclase (GGDEF)-like protein